MSLFLFFCDSYGSIIRPPLLIQSSAAFRVPRAHLVTTPLSRYKCFSHICKKNSIGTHLSNPFRRPDCCYHNVGFNSSIWVALLLGQLPPSQSITPKTRKSTLGYGPLPTTYEKRTRSSYAYHGGLKPNQRNHNPLSHPDRNNGYRHLRSLNPNNPRHLKRIHPLLFIRLVSDLRPTKPLRNLHRFPPPLPILRRNLAWPQKERDNLSVPSGRRLG